MKRMIISAMLFTMVFACVNAQVLVDQSGNEVKSQVTTSEDYKEQNSVTVEYLGVDGGWGIGLESNYNISDGHRWFWGMDYMSGETNSYVTDNNRYDIRLGYDHRYYFNEKFFIDGQAGLFWANGTYKTKYNNKTEDMSDDFFGFFIAPKIGLNLGKVWGMNLGIQAGYRWDFGEFKTSKEYTNDYFTIGLILN